MLPTTIALSGEYAFLTNLLVVLGASGGIGQVYTSYIDCKTPRTVKT